MATPSHTLRAALAGQDAKHHGKSGCVSTTVYIPVWLHEFAKQDTKRNTRNQTKIVAVTQENEFIECIWTTLKKDRNT